MLLRLSQGWMGGEKREMAITVLIIFYFCERSVCVVCYQIRCHQLAAGLTSKKSCLHDASL